MKRINIEVNEKSHNLLKKQGLNFSKAAREYFDELAFASTGDSSVIDEALLKKEYEEEQDIMLKSKIKMEEIRTKLDVFETKRAEEEKKMLKEEQKRFEKQTKCLVCGYSQSPKWHQFKTGRVCNVCFMACSSEDIEKWNSEE